MPDKVKFNLKNVHYAIMNDETWATPEKIPGAVSLSLSPEGDVSPFYADGIVYFNATCNNGYKGDLEMAHFPPKFLKDVFSYKEDTTSKVITENANIQPKDFALLYEEDGDAEGTKFVLYKVSATRPSRDFKTRDNSITPATQKISITVTPMEDGSVFAMTQDTTPEDVVKKWYESVFKSVATLTQG